MAGDWARRSSMCYSLACLSDTGVVREHNEDNFAFFGKVMPAEHQSSATFIAEAFPEHPFVVGVFDGMGGETDGESASYIAAKTLEKNARKKRWTRDDILELLATMENAVCQERDLKRAKTMGTTATLLAIDGKRAYIANVGDSPALVYTDGKLETLSHEHTDAETLRLLGITSRKPGLTQFLGMSDGEVSPSPHIVDFEMAPGDKVLLASDGLAGPLDKDTIARALTSGGETYERAMLLRDLAIRNGGTDNITVLLCEAVGLESINKDVIA